MKLSSYKTNQSIDLAAQEFFDTFDTAHNLPILARYVFFHQSNLGVRKTNYFGKVKSTRDAFNLCKACRIFKAEHTQIGSRAM